MKEYATFQKGKGVNFKKSKSRHELQAPELPHLLQHLSEVEDSQDETPSIGAVEEAAKETLVVITVDCDIELLEKQLEIKKGSERT